MKVRETRDGRWRWLVPSTLCCCMILPACAPSTIASAPKAPETTVAGSLPVSRASGAIDLNTLAAIRSARLSPDQGIDPQNRGKRIRWAGAVNQVAATDTGVCLTILYAASGEDGVPRWSSEPTNQLFKACTAGAYDSDLVAAFTNVTVVGRIVGSTSIGIGGGSSAGPIVEIEKLFRWSDCLAGDASPICKYGFLQPQAIVRD